MLVGKGLIIGLLCFSSNEPRGCVSESGPRRRPRVYSERGFRDDSGAEDKVSGRSYSVPRERDTCGCVCFPDRLLGKRGYFTSRPFCVSDLMNKPLAPFLHKGAKCEAESVRIDSFCTH